MAKLKNKFDKNEFILILIIAILIVVDLILYAKYILVPKKNQEFQQKSVIKTISNQDESNKPVFQTLPRTVDDTTKYLSSLDERSRMEYYCSEYFSHIEKKEYESAYNMLYAEFKQNYFPKLEDFEAYIEKTYPSQFAISYDDITRQGSIYVLKISVLDILGSRDNKKTQRIVLKENNYNDFVISFQVI